MYSYYFPFPFSFWRATWNYYGSFTTSDSSIKYWPRFSSTFVKSTVYIYIEHIIWFRLAPIFFFSFHYYISTPEICVSEKFYVKRVSCHIQVEAPIINFFFRISIRKRGRAKKNVNFQEFSPMKTRWFEYEHKDEMRFIYIYLRSCCVWCFVLTSTIWIPYLSYNVILYKISFSTSFEHLLIIFFFFVSKSIIREHFFWLIWQIFELCKVLTYDVILYEGRNYFQRRFCAIWPRHSHHWLIVSRFWSYQYVKRIQWQTIQFFFGKQLLFEWVILWPWMAFSANIQLARKINWSKWKDSSIMELMDWSRHV